MSNKIQIVKRLEIIKSLIELEDEDMIHLQIDKLKSENNNELKEIIIILENDDYSKINKAIDDYVYGFKNATLSPHQQEVFNNITNEISDILNNHKKDSLKSISNNFFSLHGSAGTGKTFLTSKKDDALRRRKWRHYFASKDEYADVKYIFASTIHKSQGSTYEIAYISASSILSLINRGDIDMAYRILL